MHGLTSSAAIPVSGTPPITVSCWRPARSVSQTRCIRETEEVRHACDFEIDRGERSWRLHCRPCVCPGVCARDKLSSPPYVPRSYALCEEVLPPLERDRGQGRRRSDGRGRRRESPWRGDPRRCGGRGWRGGGPRRGRAPPDRTTH